MFVRIASQSELVPFLDSIIDAIVLMVRKNGESANTAEGVLRLLLRNIDYPSCFLLIATEDMEHIEGMVFALSAVSVKPTVEMIALWTKTGSGKKLAREGCELLKKWSIEQGATRILAGVYRRPATFIKWFYEPLGFKECGRVVEMNL